MASLMILSLLSVSIGIYFVFVGVVKVTPVVHKEMHRETRRLFIHYTKVFPLSLKVLPKNYRIFVGYIEIVTGIIFGVVTPGKIKTLANVVLILLTLLMTHAHVMINDTFERTAPSLVFLFILSTGLFMQWQLIRSWKTQSTSDTPITMKSTLPPTDIKKKKSE
jgi:hypothetical protein